MLKDYLTSNLPKRFELKNILGRPTCFVSDHRLLQQLNAPTDWKHVAAGGFGSIFTAQWLGTDVVVKWIDAADVLEDEFLIFEEAMMTATVHHLNIVQFLVASPSALIIEHMANGSLSRLIHTRPMPPWSQRVVWCSQLASAVRYIHEFDVVHGDIAIDNVMFSQSDVLKLCDFGAAWFDGYCGTDRMTTDRYLPITLLSDNSLASEGKGNDTYAMVCVMLNILTWNADIYGICGLDFFERRYNEAINKAQFLKASVEVVVKKIWDLLNSFGHMSLVLRHLMFQAFSRPLLTDSDATVKSFIENCVGRVESWPSVLATISSLQSEFAKSIVEETSLVLIARTDES